MPIFYEIDRDKKQIHTRCVGDVNTTEIAGHFRDLANDPNRPKCLNVLLDLREITSLPQIEDLREVSWIIESALRSMQFGACAIVAPVDALFGMMRMFEVFTHQHFAITHVFRAIPEAETWLARNASKCA